MNKIFNHEESLSLINEMISQARNNFQKEKLYSMMYWGYLVACIAIANFVLIQVLSNPNYSFLVWLIVIPGSVVSYLIDRKISRVVLVKTHIDDIGNMLWRGFSIGIFVFIFAVYVLAFRVNSFHVVFLINPGIMILIGVCMFVSARIYQYKPWYLVAVMFWIGAIGCTFLVTDFQFIVLAVCMILGFVVPGHLLNYQAKKSRA
ncbi:MAG: hypothetical protein FWD02_06020 [Bacteroidales bacterium]|nr:hypothetical protein [Bacteroidales bacterium]